jgi:TPP-dependent pyruvate/acetoin dehydrogenase alpha subunit
MDPATLAKWKERDPLVLMRQAIGDERLTAAIEAEVNAEMEAAAEFARNSPEPGVEEFLAVIEE